VSGLGAGLGALPLVLGARKLHRRRDLSQFLQGRLPARSLIVPFLPPGVRGPVDEAASRVVVVEEQQIAAIVFTGLALGRNIAIVKLAVGVEVAR
jgi:hypothetical protein